MPNIVLPGPFPVTIPVANTSDLPAGAPLTGSELLEAEQGGVNIQIPLTSLSPFAQPSPPPQASAVGYNTLTLGPNLVLGSNWYLFNQMNVTPNAGQAVQNADGSITCSPNNVPDGSGFGGCICTTQKVGSTWAGQSFGGGLYIEAAIKFPTTIGAASLPFPAFWALDIGQLQGA